MLNIIIKSLLIILLVLQIVLLAYMLIVHIKREKEDKKFWDNIHKELDKSLKDNLARLEDCSKSEQDK